MSAFRIMVAVILGSTLMRGGTNGTLEGYVKDHRTNEPVPGVNIFVLSLNIGTTTDTAGHFIIPNLRAGKYDVRISHIGYQSYLLRGVVINPDLRTRLTVPVEVADLMLDEIVVVQEKPLIQRDITATTYTHGIDDLVPLPLDNVVDVVRLKPGVSLEGNIRGGKTTEVLYLVDGLPVQDVLSGGLSAKLPNSSITSLSIYTGGFDAEYGNALSGVVNVITKTGGNAHRFLVRAAKDDLFGGTQNSHSTEIELSASGPLSGQTFHYLASLNVIHSATRWWQDFQNFFPSPSDRTISGFGKLDYFVSPTLRIGGQVLYSHHDWRDYEFAWRFNLNGLPPELRTSYRIAAILSHTLSKSFSYTASLSRYHVRSELGQGSKDEIPFTDPYQYDFYLRYIIAGQRAWWISTEQESYTAKLDGSYQVTEGNLLRFGGEMTTYKVSSDVVKYEPRRTYFGKPLVNEPQLNFSSTYTYRPKSGAIYIQSKTDIPKQGSLLNFGFRYEFLDPMASRPKIEAIPLADTAFAFASQEFVPASFKSQISPRFGAAIQLTERGYLFVNLGWYFQFPLFDYLYTGLDRVGLAKGISALTGNPDLEPERSKLWEFSFKYSLPYNVVASATYFRKESQNLVDTKTFVPADSKLAGGFGYAEFVNNPHTAAEGLEVMVMRDRGEWITGEISYTYLVAEGITGSSTDGFYIAQFGLPPGRRLHPLSWDQRHTVKTLVTAKTPWDCTFNMYVEWHSGRPYTHYPTSTGFEKVIGGSFIENNARMPQYFNVDIRIEQGFTFSWWPDAHAKVYLDSRNLLNESNVRWVDSNGEVGGELRDPSGYYVGRRTTLGLQIDF